MADVIRVSGTRQVIRSGPTTISSPGGDINLESTNTNVSGNLNINGNTRANGTVLVESDKNTENPFNRPYDPNDIYGTREQREGAAVYVRGGVGIEKDLNVGGYIYGRIAEADTSTEIVIKTTDEDAVYYPIFVNELNTSTTLWADNTGTFSGLNYNPAQGKLTVEQVDVTSSTQSISTDTGAVTVLGGVGIGGRLTVDEIYTKVISSINSKIQIAPADPLTEIIGDIRVKGQNPIGTAPVVTNTLYVTMDGNDTNDGRAMDSSRACRTISGAVNSPYFQPGTQILVSAGHYLEDNPIKLKPYTSVRGSDIRTTFIEPINKTQDLFHLDSGTYLNYMTFLNGRSGLLAGDYTPGTNRGAYCTAFPPLEGDERIDLYHSPYIQNCTNLSGPWLQDGTMFVPNQTVQVPAAVAIGSWPANTSTLTVEVTTGTITQGMYVNAGQQNLGFYDARTLMLANKTFLQEQVVAFVDDTFNSGSFVYNTVKCSRDTGLIIDSIATDMMQNSDSDSIFAGLQYWRQDGYVGSIAREVTTTTAAINYLKGRAASIAETAGGGNARDFVEQQFTKIVDILNTDPAEIASGQFAEDITNQIISNGLRSTDTGTVNTFNAIVNAKPTLITDTIAYIDSTSAPFVYDQVTWSRDTGLVVDAVAQDILFEGNSQSIFAGLQYWNQSGYVDGIAGEITTTTAAINYVKELSADIVLGITTGTRYQSTVTQYVNPNTGTVAESLIIESEFDLILDILNNGISGVTDRIVPNGIDESDTVFVRNAYNHLQQNRKYIQAEAIAFVESTKTSGFVYDQTLCYRDVGYMVDSVSFDLLYGGNKQAIQSGVYYYGYTPVPDVAGQLPQTVAAYNYIKQLLSSVLRSIEIPEETLYQTQVLQVLAQPATPIEVSEADKRIDLMIDIINNGPTSVTEKTPISLKRSVDQYAAHAAHILKLNRDFIRAEVIAYVNTLKQFVYDKEKCRRDIGYMIDSVSFDLLHGGNKQTIKSGVYYFGYSNDVTEITNEIPQTSAAYTFIKSLITDIVTAKTIISTKQIVILQDITTHPAATEYEAEVLKSKIDVIVDIIRNGPSAAGEKEPINLEQSGSSNFENAYNQLMINKEFIKAEVIAYLNAFGTFEYSREFCYRDVGILVENVSYDAAFGGNEKSVESGLAYYDGVVSKINGQEAQTVAAIDHLNKMIQSIIINEQWTDILPVPAVVAINGTSTQIINTSVTGGAIASRSITDLFNITTNIIENGPSAAPAIYKGTNADAAYVSAEVLMETNRKFIQEDTINYINNLTHEFPYSEIKCKRDIRLIIDAITLDMQYPTANNSQSNFAGLQYWNQEEYIGEIESQLNPTVKAIEYLRDLSVKIIQNITPADDLIPRYQTNVEQVTDLESAGPAEGASITRNFNIVLEILKGNNTGWTDRYILNGKASNLLNIKNAVALLQANKEYLAYETTAYVDQTNDEFDYDAEKCRRDVGFIIDSIAFDLLHSGNKQSIQAGLSYYGFDTSSTAIRNQEIQTTDAFGYLSIIAKQIVKGQEVEPLQKLVKQTFMDTVATDFETTQIDSLITVINTIIAQGPAVAAPLAPISLTATFTATVVNAVDLLKVNEKFIQAELIAYIDQKYNPNSFNYNEEFCFRDIGLIVDAVSQDVLIGGNFKSIEAGLAYWSFGDSHVAGQETTTTMAINYARDLSLQIIANKPVTPQPNTKTKQQILPFFQYGGDYMPQQSVRRNFDIVTNIINRGPQYAPPRYLGGGLFALTGINGADTFIAPIVTSVTPTDDNKYIIGLNTSTIGFGNNSTLYFGETLVFPYQNDEVEELSLQYTGNASTWNERKIDPIGSMGGSLVDGGVVSTRSPIQSFVYDAFTQLTQGGRGVHITNDGYAQLVSVFTIFSSVGVQVDNGGIASIVNSNANFGDICLLAKGYGKRKFSGHVYNPVFKAYPESPSTTEDYLDQYYPVGFWPNNARVRVFVPDIDERPHISLIMEVEPPEGYVNQQELPGFLNAAPTKGILSTGTITIEDIDTDGIAIGNFIYIRDQEDNRNYVDTGTYVTDIGYRSVTLSKALINGGQDSSNTAASINDSWFDMYFCGNAYYTVLSSEISNNPEFNRKNEPIPVGVNVLSTASTGWEYDQVEPHADSLRYLNGLVLNVINNVVVDPLETRQFVDRLVVGGGQASEFINQRFNETISILTATNLIAAESVIPERLRNKTGTVPPGAGSAVTLISNNIEFLADKVSEYTTSAYNDTIFSGIDQTTYEYIVKKCQRDVKIILQRLIYDIQSGGRYNSVMSGLSYWNRLGAYHLVTLGENVRNPALFPDGSTVNFYQRSYMSASGYVFEYVGAGTNYGALPQRGIADPVQTKETVQLNGGKVFFTSTDQNGDFRIGPGLVISQATGVLSGRTFTKSLFANMTPFILAIESGGS